MPNFLNKTSQFFIEAFNGPRTKDMEFDMLTKEIVVIENGVMALKNILQNFVNYSMNFKKLFHDISDSIPNIYTNRSPFYKLGREIAHAHDEMEKIFDSYTKNVNRLIKKTTEWSALFTQAKGQLSKREDTRKVYDHYDEKLEKLFRVNKEMDKKKSTKEIDLKNRNIEKYKKATEAYIKASDTSYATISEVLNKRYEMINPVLIEFVKEEICFFNLMGNICKSLGEIDQRFQKVQKSIVHDSSTYYDPCRYIRGGLLITKDKIPDNFDELKSLTTEEVFQRSVAQCKADTSKILIENDKDDQEIQIISKKASLKAVPSKKDTFYAIPDKFAKKNTQIKFNITYCFDKIGSSISNNKENDQMNPPSYNCFKNSQNNKENSYSNDNYFCIDSQTKNVKSELFNDLF